MIIIAEIGQNHNGSVALAKDMISAAKDAGADYVKFAKRDVETSVPGHMREVRRETPWGTMPYIEYRRRLEFGLGEYEEIDDYCKKIGIPWFASVSDLPSFEFIKRFNPWTVKIPSAKNTNQELLEAVGGPHCHWTVIVSIGMVGMHEVSDIVEIVGQDRLVLMHCVSAYPAPNDEVNLRSIQWIKQCYPRLRGVGYSGHEIGLQITLAAVALGATYIEKHFTLSRAMWGSDQAASIEPDGLRKLCRDARIIENAMGKFGKFVQPCEEDAIRRLR